MLLEKEDKRKSAAATIIRQLLTDSNSEKLSIKLEDTIKIEK